MQIQAFFNVGIVPEQRLARWCAVRRTQLRRDRIQYSARNTTLSKQRALQDKSNPVTGCFQRRIRAGKARCVRFLGCDKPSCANNCDHFLRRFCQGYARKPAGLTIRALKALLRYDFPDNVRELQNLVERGLIASEDGQAIDLVHLFRNEPIPQELYSLDDKGSLAAIDQSPASAQPRPALLETLTRLEQGFSIEGLESRLIDEALQQSEGDLAAAARLLD